jgi:hypothetical protein
MPMPSHNELPTTVPINLSGQLKAAVANAGERWDISIADVPFRLWPSQDEPYIRDISEDQKDQFDTSGEAGENSFGQWWLRSGSSFHGGQGQRFLDSSESPDSRVRFWESDQVAVNKPGEATIASLVKAHDTISNAGPLAQCEWFGVPKLAACSSTTNEVRIYDLPDLTLDATITVSDAGEPLSITSDGENLYVAINDEIHRIAAGGSTRHTYNVSFSGTAVLAYVKDRLLLASGPHLYEIAPHPGLSTEATDTFTRSVSNGWGTSDSGHAWSVSPTASDFSANGTQGRVAVSSSGARFAFIDGSFADGEMRGFVSTNTLAAGDWDNVAFVARRADADNYYLALITFVEAVRADLAVFKFVGGVATQLAVETIGSYSVDELFGLRFQVEGSSLRARAWRAGDAEPGGWMISVVDTDLTAAGSWGTWSAVGANTTNSLPVTFSWDDITVKDFDNPEEYGPIATPNAHYTAQAPSFRWVSLSDGPNGIYAAGHSGRRSELSLISVEESGGTLVLSAPVTQLVMPIGEIIKDVVFYTLSTCGIATTKGFRVGTFTPYGQLQSGPLCVENPCYSVTAGVDLLWVGAEDSVWTIDLSMPLGETGKYAAAKRASGFGDSVVSIEEFDGLVFGSTREGDFVYDTGDDFSGPATLATSWARFGTVEPKQLHYVRVDGDFPRIDGVQYSAQVVVEADTGETVAFAIEGGQPTYEFGVPALPRAQMFRLRFTLNGASGENVTLRGWQMKALPTPRKFAEHSVPLGCWDFEQDWSGQTIGYEGFARERLQALEEIASRSLRVRVVDRLQNESYQATIRRVQFRQEDSPSRSDKRGGVVALILRRV